MTDRTCEPPPEHRGKRWHWLEDAWRNRHRYRWGDRAWWRDAGSDRAWPDEMAAAGWRYVGPAEMPQEAGE